MPRAPRLTQTLAAALLTSGLAAGLSLSGCRPKHEASANRLVIASKNRIDTVDPGGAYTFGAMQLLSAIGDTLYAINTAASAPTLLPVTCSGSAPSCSCLVVASATRACAAWPATSGRACPC